MDLSADQGRTAQFRIRLTPPVCDEISSLVLLVVGITHGGLSYITLLYW